MKHLVRIVLITVLLNIHIPSLIGQEVKSVPQQNPLIEKGLEHFKNKNYQQAVLEFRQATLAEPENAFAYYCLGLSYANLREYKEAIEPLRKSLSLDPHPRWGAVNEKMVRDLLAEVKHNAGNKPATKCRDVEVDSSPSAPGLGDDEESQKAIAILTELLHSETAARTVVRRARAYADDSPYSYSAILKITERLAIKEFCGVEVLKILKSCGDAVAAIDGSDTDLAEVALGIAELKTTESEGYAICQRSTTRGYLSLACLEK